LLSYFYQKNERMQQNTPKTPFFRKLWATIKKSLNGEEQDYTKGSIDMAIVLLAIPMILEMMMESLFAVADIFFVSKIGDKAVATVGLTESVLTLVYSIGIGLSSAATALVSRRIGEGDKNAASKAGAQVILLAVVISLLIAIPGYFYAHDLLIFMAKDPKVAESGYQFTRIMLTCNLPILLLWMLNGIFRGAGDASTSMRALWIANGVNLILDPIFIFGFGPIEAMGVTGAAVATTIGRSIGVCYQLWQLFGVGKIVKIKLSYLKPNPTIIRKLIDIGAGSTGQYLIASASWIFVMWILAQIGTTVTAGYTIAIRIIIFTILPSWGMANAAATLVGQNLGAGQPERAEKSVWRTGFLNMIFMGIVGVIYLIWAPFFIGLFSDDPQIVKEGALALRIMAGGYIFYGYGMILAQALNGAGDTLTPTLMNFIFFWLVETPLAYLLALRLDWGPTGVYWSIVTAESLLALAAIWVFKRGKWKEIKV
jgi:putative MATE family efflux protein